MMRVAFSKVIVCTVNVFDLFFVEEELPKIVLMVDLI